MELHKLLIDLAESADDFEHITGTPMTQDEVAKAKVQLELLAGMVKPTPPIIKLGDRSRREYICSNCFQVIDWSNMDKPINDTVSVGYREI